MHSFMNFHFFGVWEKLKVLNYVSRAAFSEFDAETVANLTDKQMMSISSEYGIDISRVRGVVDNANQILEVSKTQKLCSFSSLFFNLVSSLFISCPPKIIV